MKLKAGMRLKSVACKTNVMVVRAGADDIDLRCGGHPMVPVADQADEQPLNNPEGGAATLMGKRYASDAEGLEVLCTAAGDGALSIGDTPVLAKDAKAMPSSD